MHKSFTLYNFFSMLCPFTIPYIPMIPPTPVLNKPESAVEEGLGH